MGALRATTSGKMAAIEDISIMFGAFWIVRLRAATRSKSRRRFFLSNKTMAKEGCCANQRLRTAARKYLDLAWAKNGVCAYERCESSLYVWTRSEYTVCCFMIDLDIYIYIRTLRLFEMLLSSWLLLPKNQKKLLTVLTFWPIRCHHHVIATNNMLPSVHWHRFLYQRQMRFIPPISSPRTVAQHHLHQNWPQLPVICAKPMLNAWGRYRILAGKWNKEGPCCRWKLLVSKG